MWVSRWLHGMPRVLINGSIPAWRDGLGGLPWYSVLGPVVCKHVYHLFTGIEIEDMLITLTMT